MNSSKTKMAKSTIRSLSLLATAAALLVATGARAAVPGITGGASPNPAVFSLIARDSYVSQPDGKLVYSWGYGCNGAPGGFAPAAIAGASCGTMQVPGPTLIVTEGQQVQVTLSNALPTSAGSTSILFPGFTLTSACPAGQQGLLTCEAPAGGSVTYTFVAGSPGTRAYYSGTQGDLQVEMGLYGVIVVLPGAVPGNCTAPAVRTNLYGVMDWATANGVTGAPEKDFRLAASAYDHPATCYDREYLFQFSEMDLNIHDQALAQVNDPTRAARCATGAATPGCKLNVPTEPYHPSYFMINGRSMPDDMDPNYAAQYPHQPYNGNPHMHPGELTLLRIVGQGRWQHPFHEHGNHVRVLARDGNLILTPDGKGLAGPLLFTTTTTPGLAMDGIFYYSGKGLNWDMYGHNPSSGSTLTCTPDANGYNSGASAYAAINYFEWCQDHEKPVQAHPFGDVAAGGPVTLPDPNLFTNGAWYGGSPYLGPDATVRATGPTGTTPPSGTIANSPTGEAGFAFMWHSHNEREITTNNIFPGGMLMMMLVDSREFVIDESM